MKLYLNDLSYCSTQPLFLQYSVLNDFMLLIDKLRREGFDGLYVPKGFRKKDIGGECLDRIFMNKRLTGEQRALVIQMLLNNVVEMEEDENAWISESSTSSCSYFLPHVIKNDSLAVSFLFSDLYKKDFLEVVYADIQSDKESDVEIGNVYWNNFSCHNVSFSKLRGATCRNKNAAKEPLWNKAVIERILKEENIPELNRGKSPDEIQSNIIRIGRRIAELNGWGYDDNLTKKNSSKDKKRIIFHSHYFKSPYTYLCIDLRHPDGHFELNDKFGHHLGEYKFSGEKIHDSQEGHDIRV